MRLRRGSMLLRSGSRGSKAATQRSKFKVMPEGPYTPKALHAPQALYPQLCCLTRRRLYTRRRLFTRSSAALHAEGFTRAVGALPAPQVLYTRLSALNA